MTQQPFEQVGGPVGLFDTSPERQALAMLDAFTSVGAESFDLTVTDLAGKKTGFRRDCSTQQLREYMGQMLQSAAARQRNLIIRPKPAQALLIQLDDIDAAVVQTVKPVAFLILRTSPGNYQAWVAVRDGDGDFARRLKMGVGADKSASGATRISGSLNCKAKYAPAFPLVETVHVAPGLVVRRADLEARGLAAKTPPAPPALPPRHASLSRPGGPLRFPDYPRCLRDAKRKAEGQPDRSGADHFFCYLSAQWGWSVEATAEELLRVSAKAQEKGRAYALHTARDAAEKTGKHGGGA